jgi:hypothetical protein
MARIAALAATACSLAASLPAGALAAVPSPAGNKPTVSGTFAAGATVTASSSGGWTGNPSALEYDFEVCDRANCTHNVPGSWLYTLPAGWQDGWSVRVIVRAQNADGWSTSSHVSAYYGSAPLAEESPLIYTFDGNAPGASAHGYGGFYRYADTLGIQWERLEGASWTDIPGATTSDYVFASSDAGKQIRLRARATNAAGPTVVWSAPVTVKPVLSSAPTIAGVLREGEVLTAQPGSWLGAASFSYRWEVCNPASPYCISLPNSAGPTYTLGSSEAGNQVRLTVTATNAGGSVSATSERVGPVAAVPHSGPSDVTAPTVGVKAPKRLPKLAAALKSGLLVTAVASEPCTLKGQLKQGRSRVGSVSRVLGPGQNTFAVRFDKKAAKKLKRSKTLQLTLSAVAEDGAGNSRPISLRLTLKR